MARIRSIKPEFPHSESMGKVSREARLCFILLWTLSDDEGRLRGNSRMLASLLYPYDDDAPKRIEGWLSDLESQDCVIRYQVEGQSYLQICNWLNHQKIDKPSKSKFPSFAESSRILANPRESSSEDQGRDQGVDQGSSSLSGKPDDSRQLAKELIDFLNAKAGKAFRHTDANIEPILARLKEGYTLQDLKTVTMRKCREWSADEAMAQYLRPATLYNRTKFNQYIGECVDD